MSGTLINIFASDHRNDDGRHIEGGINHFSRSLEDSLADLADLGRLVLRVTSTSDLMEEALSLAAQTRLTVYDSCYAALARRLNLPLVTADEPLCQSIPWAVWLGDLEIQEG